jgi:signal transduction histidine kinase
MSSPEAAAEGSHAPLGRELNLSIGSRLAIGFGLLFAMIAAFTAAVFVWHSRSADAQREYLDHIAPISLHTDALERSLLYVGIGMRSYLLLPDETRLASFNRYAAEADAAVHALERAGEPETRASVDQIASQAQPYIEEAVRLVTQRRERPLLPQEEEHIVELRERGLGTVHRFMDEQRTRTERALAEMAKARDRVTQGIVALAIIGALVCFVIAWVTTQSVRRPTRRLLEVAGALERGDWEPALRLFDAHAGEATERSEMRKIAAAFGAAARALSERDRELREKTERIQAQNEELQAQNEEIQSQAEEIQSQSEELQAQNEELTQQGGELRTHSESLAEADERKNHFLGVLAHELRNPLAPISNSIYVMKRVPPGSEQALRAHAVIERQTRHMIRLVDDLLDITRISQGKIRVESAPVDLAAVVRAGIEDQHGALEKSGHVVEVSLPPEPVMVRGDQTRLAQVFGNLLSNAMKFTAAGGRIVVTVRQGSERGEAELCVADDGAGIDAKLSPVLFKPFSQGANAYKQTNAGLGLGLALVKALVDLHGGTVSARSDGPDCGAEFIVRLPLDGRSNA